jgi:hypothetical protein
MTSDAFFPASCRLPPTSQRVILIRNYAAVENLSAELLPVPFRNDFSEKEERAMFALICCAALGVGLLVVGALFLALKTAFVALAFPFELLAGLAGLLLALIIIIPIGVALLAAGVVIVPLLLVGLFVLAPIILVVIGICVLLH